MRDDIHKSAPVSRAWQALMRHCGREADREHRAAESARSALMDDCRREIPSGFWRNVKAALNDPQSKLFCENISEKCNSHIAGRDSQVLVREIGAHLQRREASGQTGEEAVVGALGDALSQRNQAQLRAIEGHWRNKAGATATPAIKAGRQAVHSVDCYQLARDLVNGEGNMKEFRKRTVNLDENLLRGGENDSD